MNEMENADQLFVEMAKIADGYPAADVVYALGMMLAHAIKTSCVTQDPGPTMLQIRKIIDLELSFSRSKTNSMASKHSPAERGGGQ